MLVEVSVPLPWLLECLPNQRAGGSHNGIYDPSSKVISYAHHCDLFITQASLDSTWVQTTCVRSYWIHLGGWLWLLWTSLSQPLSQVTRRFWGVHVLTEVWFHVGIYLALFFNIALTLHLSWDCLIIHGYHGNFLGFTYPWLPNYSLLVQKGGQDWK